MKKSIVILGLLLVFASFCRADSVNDLILMSEEFPPYNFIEKGEPKGTSIDVMVLILQRLGSRQTRKDIHILPWARSYSMLQEKKNFVLFAMTRTSKREHLFKWSGPISSAKNVLIAKKINKISIHSPDDLKKYTVGAVRDDAGGQLALAAGVLKKNLDIAVNGKQCIRKLAYDRFDLLAYDENVSKWLMKQEEVDPADYETVYVLNEGAHYFGFNKDTSDELIQKIQDALDQIKKDGEYQNIMDRYLK